MLQPETIEYVHVQTRGCPMGNVTLFMNILLIILILIVIIRCPTLAPIHS